MFIRRLVINALIAAARNPTVQKKAGEAAGKAFDQRAPQFDEGKPPRRRTDTQGAGQDQRHDRPEIALQEPEALEADTFLSRNDQVVVKGNRYLGQRLTKLGCHIDVGARWLGLSARMVVYKDHRLGVMV